MIRCTVKGCKRRHNAKGYCAAHYRRWQRGQPIAKTPIAKVGKRGAGYLDKEGYLRIGNRKVHRMVMEKLLGRKLLRRENVHHKNGKRTDNRPSNLELWSSHQPRGQRVVDQIAYAVEILRMYRPKLLKE